MTLSWGPSPSPSPFTILASRSQGWGRVGLPRAQEPASPPHELPGPALSPDLIVTGQESNRCPEAANFTGIGSPQLTRKPSGDVNN